MMLFGMEDEITIMIFILSLVITLVAQFYVSSSYKKYKRIKNTKGLTGFDVARKILDKNGLADIHIVSIKGSLTDHYDPRRKTLRLSEEIYNGETIASLSVAAHEVGHAIQDKDGYTFMKIRSSLVPFVNFCSKFGYIAMLIGYFASAFNLAYFGIILLSTTLLFQLVTLPVEFDASKRALAQLEKLKLVDSKDLQGSKGMLKAAAFTYVASLVTNLLQILRLVIMINNRRD